MRIEETLEWLLGNISCVRPFHFAPDFLRRQHLLKQTRTVLLLVEPVRKPEPIVYLYAFLFELKPFKHI